MKNFGLNLYSLHDIARAKRYWHETFANHQPQLPPKKPECILSIVVPVYGEDLRRIREQLDSFSNQTLNSDSFEVVYIVNNGREEATQRWRETHQKNQQVMKFLKTYTGCSVLVIDRSSGKHAIE
ncbi:MAG: hypothetical protein NUV56_02575, partial [Candidatus Uhrbacteria bacterium]|nr:hypothetical protein [Candidatus Uhrbacteria bacterium]